MKLIAVCWIISIEIILLMMSTMDKASSWLVMFVYGFMIGVNTVIIGRVDID